MKKLFFLMMLLFPSMLLHGESSTTINVQGGVNCSSGTSGQVYTTNGSTCSFSTVAGTGTMIGPGTSVANGIATYVDTGGVTMLSPSGFTIASSVLTAANILDSGLTASRAVFSDGSKNLVSNAITGTGNVVMSASPTLTGVATVANLLDSGLTASQAIFTDGSKNLVSNAITGTGNVVMSASPTFTGTAVLAAASFSGAVTGLVEELTGDIEAPTAKTYILDQSAAYAYTINTLIIQTSAGTATVAVKIGGTSVTGISAVSVSSTPATGTASGANSVSIGNQITMVVTSPSSAADMSFTLKYTR